MNETILQFGAGRFLRGFVDAFVSELGDTGSIVVVQSMGTETAQTINARQGRFSLVVPQRGENGERRETVSQITSLSRALSARDDWEAARALARSPHLRAIVSNTTEAGLALADEDTPDPPPEGVAPVSFPAKLLQLLRDRHEARLPGVAILPCELLTDNAQILYELIREQAGIWGWQWDEAFPAWMDASCSWVSTVADRIVPAPNADHPLLASDPLLTAAEPYAQWVIEDKPGTEWLASHPAVLRVPDTGPYGLRKIRLLNGAHTALVAHLKQIGRTDLLFVRDALAVPEIADWLHGVLFDEILPVVQDRAPDAEAYARRTWERFANPFLDHRLSDIALHHDTKLRIRLVPTYEEYRQKFGHPPARLGQVIGG